MKLNMSKLSTDAKLKLGIKKDTKPFSVSVTKVSSSLHDNYRIPTYDYWM